MTKRKWNMPTAYSILFLLIILVAAATWLVPAGEYEYITDEAGHSLPLAGSYRSAAPSPQGIGAVILASFHGFYDAADICLFILAVGGFLGVAMKTGAITAGIGNVVGKLKGKELWLIPILMILFGLGGTTFGMAEETIAFYPLLLPIFLMAGFDTLTAVAVILLGAGMGVIGSTVNPFATGIASGFAGVSLGDGILPRLLILAVAEGLAIAFVLRYGIKVRKNPALSMVTGAYDRDTARFSLDFTGDLPPLTGKRKVALILFALTFLVMIYGVIPFDALGNDFLPTLNWSFPELSGLFLIGGILIGTVYRLKEKEIADAFVQGAAELLGVALIIAVSRGITVIMNDGNITATILHSGETLLKNTSPAVFTALAYGVYLLFSFLVPSSSGLATLSVPIMAPLGEFSGVASSLLVTVFQTASGVVNIITPTSAVVMGGLAFAKIPYPLWLKFIWKYLLLLTVLCGLILTAVALTGANG